MEPIAGHRARGPWESMVDKLLQEEANDLIQDDYGVWEVVWRANALFGDQLLPAEVHALAREVIDRLLKSGLVELTMDGEVVDPARLPALAAITSLVGDPDVVDTTWWLRVTDVGAFRARFLT